MTAKKQKPQPVIEEDVDDDVDLEEMVPQPTATSAAMLCVNVDVNDLLERFGDPRQVFALLCNLKDLLR